MNREPTHVLPGDRMSFRAAACLAAAGTLTAIAGHAFAQKPAAKDPIEAEQVVVAVEALRAVPA